MTNESDIPIYAETVDVSGPLTDLGIRYQLKGGPLKRGAREIEAFGSHHSVDLKPHASLCFSVDLFVSDERAASLALNEPGEYEITVVYPLVIRLPRQGVAIESNTIRVLATPPAPRHAALWKRLDTPEMTQARMHGLEFVRNERRLALGTELAAILMEAPDSPWAASLRPVVRNWLDEYRKEIPDETALRIGRFFGPFEEKLFPDDKRLDKKITLRASKRSTYAEYWDDISGKAGVPLQLGPNHERFLVANREETGTVRFFMERIGSDSRWVIDGDGYKLLTPPREPYKPPPPYGDCSCFDREEAAEAEIPVRAISEGQPPGRSR